MRRRSAGGATPVTRRLNRRQGRRQLLRRAALPTVTVAALGFLAGCEDDGPAGFVEVDPGSAEGVTVQALDNTFRAEMVAVSAGTEVRWENVGLNEHDIVPRDDSGAWGVAKDGFAPGDIYSAIFEEPGEYHYYCSLHGTETSGMIGTIVVEGGE